MVSNGTALPVSNESGRMYRMLVDDLSSQLVSVGHTAKVIFQPHESTYAVTPPH